MSVSSGIPKLRMKAPPNSALRKADKEGHARAQCDFFCQAIPHGSASLVSWQPDLCDKNYDSSGADTWQTTADIINRQLNGTVTGTNEENTLLIQFSFRSIKSLPMNSFCMI